jgi:hypothetical protein
VTQPLKVVAIADSDSYVKWGAALLRTAPSEWQRQLFIIATPVMPSGSQLAAALEGSTPENSSPESATQKNPTEIGRADVLDLSALVVRVGRLQPDVVLISVRGPLVKVIVRAIVGATSVRPVIVTGLPGISIPATRMAIAHRAQADLFILHSRREVEEFSALATRMGIDQTFSLATLPFLPSGRAKPDPTGDVIFAAQAKVPEEKSQRIELLGWLAESARRHPKQRVVIKVRAAQGEQQTHSETHDYAALLSNLQPTPPANLVVESGPMSAHLAHASGLVTVSSTAAIEAVALGVPVLALSDFGVKQALINTVFADSGLLGSSEDLIAGRFNHPEPAWLGDNYFHGSASDTWVEALTRILTVRATGVFPLKSLRRGVAGGRLRKAWDRKRSLGRFDRSLSGSVALAVGIPALLALRSGRRLRRLVLAARPTGEIAD